VGARLTALEHGLNTFAQVHADNARIINHGFGMQDSHIAVQYRVLNDIRKGDVMVDEHGDIAVQFYHQIYAATRSIADGLAAMMAWSTKPEPVLEPVGNLIPLPDFGGDHAGA